MINHGEQIREGCRKDKCIHYNTIIELSNNAELNNNVVCPQVFCNYVFNKETKKELTRENIPIENKEKIQVNKDIILQNLNKHFVSKKINLEMYWDISEQKQEVCFFNPLNSTPTPLVISFEQIKNDSFDKLIVLLEDFFKTFIDSFIEKECKNCIFEKTNHQSISCVDCIRNKTSLSIIKKDRFKNE